MEVTGKAACPLRRKREPVSVAGGDQGHRVVAHSDNSKVTTACKGPWESGDRTAIREFDEVGEAQTGEYSRKREVPAKVGGNSTDRP